MIQCITFSNFNITNRTQVETNLSPTTLLKVLKKIETIVGRVPSIRNGPRAIDLDILLYDSETVDTRLATNRSLLDNLEGQLVVPHPRIAEREFVLRPLNEYVIVFFIENRSLMIMLA
jgi:dihydroneopterin aldolase / 2-amino-4-hydroxy-6-hydroxymethyldihydropteridine diphosphokinase / dihydropteroate synthase